MTRWQTLSHADSVNAVKPGSEPLSSMSPTIILNEDGSPFLVIGTPGGSKNSFIINSSYK